MTAGHDPSMALPLTDIRVVDAGGATTAYCAKLLWDLGADVTVLEPPGGNELRRRAPFHREDARRSLVFDWYHGASTSVTVDPADLDALRSATAGADVVLLSSDRSTWPLDEDRPTWVPPGAVVCSISPFGRGGPYESHRATHLVSAAVSGRMHQDGPVDGPPVALPAQVHWDVAAAHGALSVLAALRVRPAVGGQEIEISAQEVETTLEFWLERYSVAGATPTPRGTPIGIPPSGSWRCADGLFEISAYQVHHWQAFLELAGRPEELTDPALGDMATRRERANWLSPLIAAVLAPHDRLDLLDRAQALGLPSSVRNTPGEFVADEQLATRGAIIEREVRGRRLRLPASPLRADVRLSRDTPGEDGHATAPAAARPSGPAPLSGVRVLSLGAFYAGNSSASLLAGLGAEVVKIEPLARPEVLRRAAYRFEPRDDAEPSGVPTTPMFSTLARGMRNLALDVKRPEGLAVFRRLVAEADIVIENFGTGTMERQGMGFDELAALNPHLVMLSLSGYGRTGPRAGYLAYAANISSFCGLTGVQAQQFQLSDAVAAIHGAIATVAALDHARHLGRAIHVDIAQIEAMASVMAPLLLDPLVNGITTTPAANAVPGSSFSGVFVCLGIDSWVAVEATDVDERNALATLVGRLDLDGDWALDTDRLEALTSEVAMWCSGRTRHTAAHLLQRSGVPAGAVQSVEDVSRDPQLRARGFPVRMIHPDVGVVEYPGPVHHLSATPAVLNAPGRRLGSDTRDLLQDWLSMDDGELAALTSAGVIASFHAGTP
jgi:crotonobetainyl-CoA:carnitine CoA-transferase CaiB-like acyl-CoA transferase